MPEPRFKALQSVETNPLIRRIWLFTTIVVVILISFLFLPWQQTVKGEGTLMAYDPSERVQAVSATIDGVIETFHVRENEEVKEGDRLFTMVDLDRDYAGRVQEMERQLREQLENTRREIETIGANRDNAKEQRQIGIALYRQRRTQAEELLQSLKLRQTALRKQFETEQAHYERVKRLYEESIESRRSLERADAAYIQAKTELEKVEIDLSVQQRNLEILDREQTQFVNEADNRIRSIENEILSARTRSSALERDLQRQQTDIARYASSVVRARKDGEVIKIITSDKNRLIRQGEPVLQFVPLAGERAVRLRISDFNMPLVREGLKVRMMFYGWPALQVSGWPVIRFGTFGGIIKQVDPVSYEKGFYYAYIVEDPAEPWPPEDVLRRGTQATVWVALETVPVWYQLWRLMNAFPPKMLHPEGPKQ